MEDDVKWYERGVKHDKFHLVKVLKGHGFGALVKENFFLNPE